jgi:hypothetical protein
MYSKTFSLFHKMDIGAPTMEELRNAAVEFQAVDESSKKS